MRIIKAFKWCPKYKLEQIEIDYDLNNKNVIIYKAKRIKNIKHMIEIIKWAKGFAEYKKVFDKNWCLLIGRWLYFNFNKSHNDYIVFKP